MVTKTIKPTPKFKKYPDEDAPNPFKGMQGKVNIKKMFIFIKEYYAVHVATFIKSILVLEDIDCLFEERKKKMMTLNTWLHSVDY